MIDETNNIDGLSTQIENLETHAEDAKNIIDAFSGALQRTVKSTNTAHKGIESLSRTLETSLKGAFEDIIFGEHRASDALRNLSTRIIDTLHNILTKVPSSAAQNAHFRGGGFIPSASNEPQTIPSMIFGKLFGAATAFGRGGVFSQARVIPFAHGGIISQATAFPMRSGTGLMGEAGPEAIMPLSRGADGRLGVRMDNGTPIHIVMNIQTQDAESFQRSKTQIAADLSRAISRGQRNQ